jgi:cytoskeleton protein RodZ
LDILAGKDPTAAVIASRSNEKTPAKTTEAMVQQHIEQQSQAVSELSFQFSADCWVEVLDGDNQKIFSSLQKAQERLVLEGKPPFHVTLGYAPGVSLSYNGEPIEIDAKNAKFKKLVLGNS